MLTDTHCHLNFNTFDPDRAQVIERALAVGVTRILNPGIDLDSSRAGLQLAQDHAQIFAAVGVHPNDALSWQEDTLDQLRELAAAPKAVAVGEIGLDYYRDWAPADAQRRIFILQLQLAAEAELPVVIHTRNASPQDRRATAEALDLLADWRSQLAQRGSSLLERVGVLHSYSDDLPTALRAIELGFCIGITGPLTFRNAEQLRQVAAGVPLERLLIETDSPFLTPHPHRGQRNEPAYVRFVAEKIAHIHDLSVEVVAEQTTANAARLFKW